MVPLTTEIKEVAITLGMHLTRSLNDFLNLSFVKLILFYRSQLSQVSDSTKKSWRGGNKIDSSKTIIVYCLFVFFLFQKNDYYGIITIPGLYRRQYRQEALKISRKKKMTVSIYWKKVKTNFSDAIKNKENYTVCDCWSLWIYFYQEQWAINGHKYMSSWRKQLWTTAFNVCYSTRRKKKNSKIKWHFKKPSWQPLYKVRKKSKQTKLQYLQLTDKLCSLPYNITGMV